MLLGSTLETTPELFVGFCVGFNEDTSIKSTVGVILEATDGSWDPFDDGKLDIISAFEVGDWLFTFDTI
jgi:hypothetical protein